DVVIADAAGFTHAVDTLSFTLTRSCGIWASAADVLKKNAKGNQAAVHVFVTAASEDAANGALVTGFAGANDPVTLVPAPASVILLGLGGFGLAGIAVGSRRRQAQAA